jgi:drug/metabolite transporter (DMT)-like permease
MAYFLLILTVLFWSGNFVLGRGVNEIIPPVALAFWRWTGALAILLPFSINGLIRQRAELRKNLGTLTVLAILSVTNFNTFIYNALQSTTVVNTVLINSTTPIFIVLVAWLGFKDRITTRQTIGVVVSFVGLVWLVSHGQPAVLLNLQFSRGDLWTLAAAMSWALYTVLLRKRPKDLAPLPFLTALVGIGLFFLAPVYIWEIRSGATFDFTPAVAASFGYVALFPSVLSYIFWNRAVAVVGANKAGIFMHLMPVFSILLAFVFLGETLAFYHLIGILLIFFGIVLITMSRT